MRRLRCLSPFKHSGHLLVVPAVLGVYGLMHPWLWVLALVLTVRLAFFDWRLAAAVIVVVSLGVWRFHAPNVLPKGTKHEGEVLFVQGERAFPRMGVATEGVRLLVFHEEAAKFVPGDRAVVYGDAVEAEFSGFFDDFDYQRHLRGEGIHGVVYADAIDKVEGEFSLYSLRGSVFTYVQRNFGESRKYVEAFVLAERGSFDEATIASISQAGLMHLFAVSGLHVSLLALAVYKAMRLLTKNPLVLEVAVACFLAAFLFLTGFSPSVLRASFLAVFLLANKRFGWGFSPVDALSYLALFLLAFSPFSAFHAGYQLSFSVSFSILLSRRYLSKRNPVAQSFAVSLIAFLTSLPVVLSMQYGVNLLTVFFNVLYVWFFVAVFLPATYILFLLPFLEPLFLALSGVFEASLDWLDRFEGFRVSLYIPRGLWTLAYFVLLYGFLVRLTTGKEWLQSFFVLGLFVMVVAFSAYLAPYQEVTMFAVHGDAFLVRDAHHRCNILIDAGESDRRESLANALSRMNIRHLDYVFITHKHYDHYGGYESVANRFPIGHTVTNRDIASYEGREIACGELKFILFPLEHPHAGENDRSLVIRMAIGGETYLFTGDIETPREQTLLELGRSLEADVLKVPHHGSLTSSTLPFLEAVSASDAMVSAHWNSRFNHPHPSVMERYEALGIDLHRIDEEGSVRFRYLFHRRFKKTAFE